jgi:hypothetical protein
MPITFAQIPLRMQPTNIGGVAGQVAWNDCQPEWKHVIRQIQQRTNKLRKYVRRGFLNETATYDTNADNVIAHASLGLPIRSSHGSPALQPQPYQQAPQPITIAQMIWYRYAESAVTGHAQPGTVPGYIEFHIAAPGGLRILYDYMNDRFLITDHYVTYYEVAAPALF